MTWLTYGDAIGLIVAVAMWVGFGYVVDHSPWSARSLTTAVNKQRYAGCGWRWIAISRSSMRPWSAC